MRLGGSPIGRVPRQTESAPFNMRSLEPCSGQRCALVFEGFFNAHADKLFDLRLRQPSAGGVEAGPLAFRPEAACLHPFCPLAFGLAASAFEFVVVHHGIPLSGSRPCNRARAHPPAHRQVKLDSDAIAGHAFGADPGHAKPDFEGVAGGGHQHAIEGLRRSHR